MAHHHQPKRPYAGTRSSAQQSSITSFFSPSTTTSLSQHPYALPILSHPSNTSSQPYLPHAIQSSLLNVGMRVRKSVPEGYKTGSYSAFALFSDAPPSPTHEPAMAGAQLSTRGVKTRLRSGNRELTPFCGILSVGGMGAQQHWEEDEDDLPFLSSQGSTISSSSFMDEDTFSSNTNKRRFFEEEEEMSEGSVVMGGLGQGQRPMAVPRRKKGLDGEGVGKGGVRMRVFGQENSGNGEGDFGDAEFLDYEGLVAGEEVQMGGC